jgi:protein gp37
VGKDSGIEWCDHTFNPWTGCTRISPGCDHCYAATLAKRSPATFGSWDPGAERKRTSLEYWRQPFAWNRKAQRDGVRRRVFCASMADVFDNRAPAQWRFALWDVIRETPYLDWLLLTKRPQNIAAMLPPDWGRGWPHVWLGATVENQAEADRRIPVLLGVPAAVRFLSCEPLLGPVDLRFAFDADTGECIDGGWPMFGAEPSERLHWVITGGESGPGARPSHPDWHRALRDQCAEAGVPFFFKQWGNWLPGEFGAGPLIDWQDGQCSDRHKIDFDNAVYDDGLALVAEGHRHVVFWRAGKYLGGALLDGREHQAFPA